MKASAIISDLAAALLLCMLLAAAQAQPNGASRAIRRPARPARIASAKRPTRTAPPQTPNTTGSGTT